MAACFPTRVDSLLHLGSTTRNPSLAGSASGTDILKTPNKLVAGFGTSLLIGAGLVLLAGAAPASAHTPNVVPTCDDVTVTLTNYGASDKNTIKVTIDGEIVEEKSFGKEFTNVYPFADRTVAHTYRVEVDAPGAAYDVDKSDSSTPCPAPVVPPVVVPEKPEPVESATTEEKVDCDSKTVTTITTTTTTGWTLDEKSNTWTKTEPVTTVTEKERAATPAECKIVPPTTVVPPVTPPTTVTPPVTPPTTVVPPVTPPTATTTPVIETTPVADKLPSTGSDMGWTLPLAGGLLLAGIALMLVRRTRRA